MIKFPLLTTEDIQVKVKQCTKSGVLLLLYKTARVDAKILDEVVGPMNWTDEYVEVKGNLYCKIGIREKEDQDFVYKMDCGIESDQDDGQEKKAEASDAFKRCATKLGIGRELYTSPKIWASIPTVQKGEKYFLENKYSRFYVSVIEYTAEKKISKLEIREEGNDENVVYSFGMDSNNYSKADDLDIETAVEKTAKPAEKTTKKVEQPKETAVEKEDLKTLVREIGYMVKAMTETDGSPAQYKEIIKQVTGGTTFKCNVATEDDYDTVLAIRNALVASGYNV